ncbi:MAG TPA: hypothetical protein VM900_00070 [Sphingomonas sp.]|jgi:hypothetical protein|nr:hypothetical protein [Sphingomonas sp.]
MIDPLEKAARLVGRIARLALNYSTNDRDRLLLYVEAEEGMHSLALYAEKERHIQVISTGADISKLIDKLWRDAPSDKKWMAFALIVEDGNFTINYYYPDGPPAGRHLADRHLKMVAAHFGRKPIHRAPVGTDGDD